MSTQGILEFSQISEPSPTTDKLYNVGGNLKWNGEELVTECTNVGNNGVGMFKGKNGPVFEVKKINAGSNKITVTDDVPNNECVIDIAEGNIVHDNLYVISFIVLLVFIAISKSPQEEPLSIKLLNIFPKTEDFFIENHCY